MARRYRCLNCQNEFIADKPACVHCEIDATTDKVAAQVVIPLALIHYDPPHSKIKGKGQGHRACDPSVPIGKGRGTGEARQVNCEACKATKAYQDAAKNEPADGRFLESEDEVIGVDARGVLTAQSKDEGCKGCD